MIFKNLSSILTLIPLLLNVVFVSAQQNISSFKHLSTDDGLSQNSVNTIYQDHRGFMWFGTQDGLNRYDGYDFLQFRNERGNNNSISNNYIWDLYEDENHILWIATFGGGLNSLNLTTNETQHYNKSQKENSFPSNRIFCIEEDRSGMLWLGCNEGLVQFDKSTKKSKMFLSHETSEGATLDNYVGTLAIDIEDNIWLQSDSGLTRFNTITEEINYFQKSPFSDQILLGDLYDIKCYEDKIYVACGAGLLEIDVKNKTDKLILSASKTHQDTDYLFQEIVRLEKEQFFIGTNKGLIIYNSQNGQIKLLQNEENNDESLSHNNVLSMHQSKDGIVWIGTRNGLNIIETLHPSFEHIRKIKDEEGLSANHVNSFAEEDDELLWIGTTDGLNLINRLDNSCKVFRKDSSDLESNYVLCLFKDSKDRIWIGTSQNGFYQINRRGDNEVDFVHIKPQNFDASTTSIHFITEDVEGALWIGTGGKGLWKYDPEQNRVKVYDTAKDGTGPSHPYVFSILQDSYNNIWLGTPTGGLNLFDPKTERFLYFQNDPEDLFSLSNDIILSLFEDKDENLWIGTVGGLNKLIKPLRENMYEQFNVDSQNRNDSLFINFDRQNGFPNEVIYGMLQDDNGNLWMSTNMGLVEFNIELEEVVNSFDVSNGIQSNEFNQNGYFKSRNGQMYFGGINGYNVFYPDSISVNNFIPDVLITGLSILNRPVLIDPNSKSEEFTLKKTISELDELNLSWEHDVITLDFAALSYVSPEKNKYRYKLEGLRDEWIEAGYDRSVTYTNLDPGTYVFNVQACNSSGLWNLEGASIQINISTPPWASWYAYLIYVSLIVGFVYSIIRFRIKQATYKLKIQSDLEKARIEEREEFRKRSSQDFHDETGTKITRISLITELAKRNANDPKQVISYLDKVEENIQSLNSGMRDFIWVLDPANDNFYSTLSRFSEFAEKFCQYADIRFKMNTIPGSLLDFPFNMTQRRHLLFILKEALNNAIKYSEADLIEFDVDVQSEAIYISLSDNGIGFEQNEESSGNGLRNMRDRAKAIDSNIEINSEISGGTKIVIGIRRANDG